MTIRQILEECTGDFYYYHHDKKKYIDDMELKVLRYIEDYVKFFVSEQELKEEEENEEDDLSCL